MADKGTTGDLEDMAARKVKDLSDKLTARTLELAGDAAGLVGDQVVDLLELSIGAVQGLLGDKRIAAHVNAQLKLQSFSGQARAYLELVEFRKAFADALVETAKEIATEGAPIVLSMLLGSLGVSA